MLKSQFLTGSFLIGSIVLALTLGAGELAAQSGVAVGPDQGGPRYWEVTDALNLREERSTSSAIVGKYLPGTILNNLGCEAAGGRTWCDVQELGGGPVGYVVAEYLRPAAGPNGDIATGPDDSALRAGQGDFNATGTIPCAQFAGQPTTECAFGVARGSGGDATVVVTRPDGTTRTIFFQMGIPMGADTSQADGYPEFSNERQSDLNLISVGVERYEIPDAIPLGG